MLESARPVRESHLKLLGHPGGRPPFLKQLNPVILEQAPMEKRAPGGIPNLPPILQKTTPVMILVQIPVTLMKNQALPLPKIPGTAPNQTIRATTRPRGIPRRRQTQALRHLLSRARR